MSSDNHEAIFSNDAEITILDEKQGVTDTTHRPLTGARREAALKFLEKQAELRRLMEEMKAKEAATKPTGTDSQ